MLVTKYWLAFQDKSSRKFYMQYQFYFTLIYLVLFAFKIKTEALSFQKRECKAQSQQQRLPQYYQPKKSSDVGLTNEANNVFRFFCRQYVECCIYIDRSLNIAVQLQRHKYPESLNYQRKQNFFGDCIYLKTTKTSEILLSVL